MLDATPPVDPALSLFVEGVRQAVVQLLLLPLLGYRDNLLQAAADPSGREGAAQAMAPQRLPLVAVRSRHPNGRVQEVAHTPPEYRGAFSADETILADPDAKRFLHSIVEHPFRSIREIYTGLRLSALSENYHRLPRQRGDEPDR